MKQLIGCHKTGELKLEEVPAPILKPNGVLIKNHYSLVSAGTERAVIEFAKQSLASKARSRPDLVKQVLDKIKTDGLISTYRATMQRLDEPLPLGYSSAGEIIEISQEVEGFSKGDLLACGGGGYASHAEVIFVPKNLMVKIPDNVSVKEAAFVALGAIAIQGVRRADLMPGDQVAIIGLGLIGQLTVQILNAYGFPILGLDLSQNQIEKTLKMGLQEGTVIGQNNVEKVANAFSGGRGMDAVIITAATKSNKPIELAGGICRDKGRISVVGDVGMNIPRNIYYEKELDLRISRSYGPGRYDTTYEEKGIDYPIGYIRWTEKRNMEEFLRLISIGHMNVRAMVSHVFSIEDALKAYELILENPNKEDFTGVLLEYDPAKEHKTIVKVDSGKKERVQKNSLNVGLIGAGNFATNVILPNIRKIKKLNINVIADSRGEMAKYATNKYHCKYITSDYKEILNDPEIDLVIIATRHNLHAEIACEALRKDKNIHLEKPMAMNIKELKEVIESEKISKGRLMLGFNRRFAPLIMDTKKQLSKINTPLMIYYRINAGYIPKESWIHDKDEGGGRIIGEICHFIDLLQFLTNSTPERVYATKISAQEPVIENDNVEITIDFSNGSRGIILYTSLGSKAVAKEYLEIFADENVVIIDNFKSGKIYEKNKSKKLRVLSQDKGHRQEFENFAHAILNGDPSPISMVEQIISTLTTYRVLESIEKKEPVEINLAEVIKE